MTENHATITLKVAEAQSKDVGRGIARVDPEAMQKLGIAETGEIIEIEGLPRGGRGKKKTVAKVMPTFPEIRGKSIIQIDGLIRENAGASLDEKVKLRKTTATAAKRVTLTPITIALSPLRDIAYLTRQLTSVPVVEGDRIQATFLGTRKQDFRVVTTTPSGPVLLTAETVISVAGQEGKTREAKITYEDIGGLGREIHRIREMIELPLRYPQVFDRLGIEAPKGVLLYGPPGCGKTLIAKVIANETDAYFLQLSGPEIMHKFYGESEAHLREVFEDARRNAPSILFLDEIDAIAPKREELGGEKQVERRVVAQLLALLDGLKERGQVIVIGATNIPNSLDPALRRPGRFDREISIPIPDKNGRLEILTIHTRGMPLSDDPSAGSGQVVNLEKLAFLTHGFVGADLASLCREAAMRSLRRLMTVIDFEEAVIPEETLLSLKITMEDFLDALREIEPSAIREVFTEVPDVTWEDVGGLTGIKQLLIETIEWPLHHPEVFSATKTRPAKGILLTGTPGCGKTLLAKAVASQSGVNFISVKGPALLTSYVGESERAVREVFKKARMAAPCFVFFDEIESLVPKRGGGADSHVTERVVSQFLTEIDGIEELTGVVILAASNRTDLIDPALLRPGRFDYVITLPAPDIKGREEIFKIHTKGKPLASDVSLGVLAKETEGMVGAEIASICGKAGRTAIREFLESKEKNINKLKITMKQFTEALKDERKGDH